MGIPDLDHRLAVALACYSPDAIVYGLASFRAKKENGTLPPDAEPGRYLGGIIRQRHTRLELERTSEQLLEQRLRLRDITLEPLTREAERLRDGKPPADLPRAFLDHALAAVQVLDFRYWTRAAVDALSALSVAQKTELNRPLCRRIAAAFRTERPRREDLIARFAEAMAAA